MIRRIDPNDRNLFVTLSKEFYSTDAVSHTIPHEYHKNSFDELMRSDEYIECFIFEQDGETAGYALIAKLFPKRVASLYGLRSCMSAKASEAKDSEKRF